MKNLAKSLWIFRTKIEWIRKSADNPFFKSKYADLASILEWMEKPMEESGLALTHAPKHSEWAYNLVSTLIDIESGETMVAEFPIFWNKPQEVWSSISYARRYNTLALLDIPTLDDDDGNTANEAPRTKYTWATTTKWLNFKELKQAIDWGTDTEVLLTEWIKDNEYTLSGAMKTCIRTYCDTGELIAPEFKK